MKFELNEYKKELTDEEILSDIKEVASSLNCDYIAISTYKKQGKYSQCAIRGHFGTWKNALLKAGLRTERTSTELKRISDEEYFADLRRVSRLISCDTVPYEEYRKFGKYSPEYICTRFGKWNNALKQADLKETGFTKDKITQKQCFDEIERIWILLGRQPIATDIVKGGISYYSIDTFKRRFGGWRKALEAFVQYVNSTDNQSEDTNKSIQYQEAKSNETTYEKPQNLFDVINTNGFDESKISHQTSRNINARLRFLILKRDNFKCCACGASPEKDPSVELQIDHIIPWSKGGETVEENLQTLCSKCNLGKSNL